MPSMYFTINYDGEVGEEKVFFVRIFDQKPQPGDKCYELFECFAGEVDEETQQYLEFQALDNDPKYQEYLASAEGIKK